MLPKWKSKTRNISYDALGIPHFHGDYTTLEAVAI